MIIPSTLPGTFTAQQARVAGLTKHALHRLRDRGELELLGRGVYRRRVAELADLELIELATRSPRATLCLASALVKHNLSDAIPAAFDLALPRGARSPRSQIRVNWHWFEAASFELEREQLALDAHTSIGIYSAERSIVDAFRMRGREGHELANEALKRWLRRRGAQPSVLLALAEQLPRSRTPLRRALEILV